MVKHTVFSVGNPKELAHKRNEKEGVSANQIDTQKEGKREVMFWCQIQALLHTHLQLNLLWHLLNHYPQYLLVKKIYLMPEILLSIYLFYCLHSLGQLTCDKVFYECVSCGFELLNFLEEIFCWMN